MNSGCLKRVGLLLVGFLCFQLSADAGGIIKNDLQEYDKRMGFPPRQDVLVKNVEEFLMAIAPHTRIILAPGIYDCEIEIADIKGLTIEGEGKVSILSSKEDAVVMKFDQCPGLVLKNLIIGHALPPKLNCGPDADVVHFSHLTHALIDGCTLIGSGHTGLFLYNTYEIQIVDSIITECSYRAVSINRGRAILFHNCQINANTGFESISVDNSGDIRFISCRFQDNGGRGQLVVINDSAGIHFLSCQFLNNWRESEESGEVFFVKVSQSAGIVFEKTLIKDNIIPSLSNDVQSLKWIDARVEENEFMAPDQPEPRFHPVLAKISYYEDDLSEVKAFLQKERPKELSPYLLQAVLNNKAPLVKLLLEMGANPNRRYRTEPDYHGPYINTLLNATVGQIENGVEISRLLLTYGAKVDEPDAYGRTPLIIASEAGALEVFKLLIQNGADVNKAARNYAPIHAACRWAHPEIVRMLIDVDAELNGVDPGWGTPLHYAATKTWEDSSDSPEKKLEIAAMLINAGAEVNVVCERSPQSYYTALDLAESNQNTEMVELLKKNGGKTAAEFLKADAN